MNERNEFATQLGAVLGKISGFASGFIGSTLVSHLMESRTGFTCLGCALKLLWERLH